jgi:putative ABC transport system permease protein
VAAWTLGIGSATAIVSVADDVLLDALPFAGGDRLVMVWESHPERGIPRIPATPARFRAWESRDDLFQGMALFRQDAMDLTGRGEPRRIEVGRVLPRIFPLLGREAVLGRLLAPEEAVSGADDVAVVSHDFWRHALGSDPDAVGAPLRLDGRTHTVVGVLEPGPALPLDVAVYTPLALDNWESRSAHAYRAVARLAPAVSLDEADRGLAALSRRMAAEHPDTDAGFEARVQPLREALTGEGLPRSVLLFQAAGLLVLLLAAANAGTLVLVRALGRQGELAVRTALGAPRRELVRELAVESLLLAGTGAVLGLALAAGGVEGLLAWRILELPPVGDPGLDGTGVLFAVGSALVAGLLFGVLPGLRGTRAHPAAVLRGAGSTRPSRNVRLRRVLVAGEVALATILVLASGLLVRSLDALRSVDPGFEAGGRVALEIRLPEDRYPTGEERLALYGELLAAADAHPGVDGAALVSHLPLTSRSDRFRFQIEGSPPDRFADLLVAHYRVVSPGYLETLEIPVLRGRGLTPGDGPDAEPVALVSRITARTFWPDADPLNARLSFSGNEGPWVRVVGVVEDIRHGGPAQEPWIEIYRPMAQEAWPSAHLVVRPDGPGEVTASNLRAILAQVDPGLAPGPVRSLDVLLSRSRGPWLFQAAIVGFFGSVALLLAGLGIYGLVGYLVQARRQEFGVRRALGARNGNLGRLVGAEVAGVVGPAVIVAVAAAVAGRELLAGFLFGVGTLDPPSYLGAVLLLAVAAGVAVWRPLRRALRDDPARALRPD